MLLYYITDRRQFPGDDAAQRRRLLDKIAEAAAAGVDYIQLREKDLCARELQSLAREAVAVLRRVQPAPSRQSPAPKLLINSRADVALACGADGVHLRSDDVSPADVRALWSSAISRIQKLETSNPLLAVSCHSMREVALAESQGADFVVFAPVFEKSDAPGVGLAALREACHRAAFPSPNTEDRRAPSMPVLALGGITVENARACAQAGAAGIAAIRLFQENDIAAIVAALNRPKIT
ncbi:MAG TPA: thiamine phosphate synthase [Terriglobales bacterium]|nr:thiamine phosphate synthase [Terriglobales bacterium]